MEERQRGGNYIFFCFVKVFKFKNVTFSISMIYKYSMNISKGGKRKGQHVYYEY